MKNTLLFVLVILFFSCGDNRSDAKIDSLKTDSILRSQQVIIPPPDSTGTDTIHTVALPPVFEGDIVMQISDDPQHVAFGKACGSKYNHVGIIFIRPRDRQYIVLEMRDSIIVTPLIEWSARGQGEHFVLLRMKKSNQILNEQKTAKLKKGAKKFNGINQDNYYSWADDELYSTELIYKIYKQGLNIDICIPGKLGDLDLTGLLIHGQMMKKYGTNIPMDERFISPDAIYKSPKMAIIYER